MDADALEALAALAQSNRLAVFRVLMQQAPRALSAAEIAAPLKVTPSSLSLHLTRLARAGLIIAPEDPRRYRANTKLVRALGAHLGFAAKA